MEKERKLKVKKEKAGRMKEAELWEAMDELLRLYCGWMGYLLRRQGEKTLRVKVSDIKEALETLTVFVTCEDGEYVITLMEKGGDHEGSQ